MASTTVIDNLTQTRYGAPELKKFIQKNTLRGFFGAAGTTLLLLLLYFIFFVVAKDESSLKAPVVKVKLTTLPPPPPSNAEPPPVPPPTAPVQVASGPAARAGTPVPVPDAMIAPDLKDFASQDEISRASAEGGEGEDFGGFSDGIGDGPIDYSNLNVEAPREEEPDPDEFVAVEKEPVVDLKDIQSRAVYPEIAKRAGVEGKVTLRVLVGKDGKPKKAEVLQSDNEWFNESAVKAVMHPKTIFTPAIQNGQALAVWVTIPVAFKLR